MQVVAADGARLRAVVEGPIGAATLLFVNSIGCDHTMWDAQAAALSDRYRVIRYDARGHGGSDAPAGDYDLAQLGRDALAVLDAAGADRAHICGLSLGGLTAQWLAINAPQRVGRLVLANTAAKIGTPQGWIERTALVREQGMASLADAALSRFFSEPFRATSPEVVAAFRRVLSETAAGGYAGCCAALRDADLRAEIGRISAPTLVIAGSLDASTPPDQGDELARGVADGRLTVVDAAHLSNIERPDDFTAALRGHLEII